MLHTRSGEIVLVNHAFEESIGYVKEELPTMETWMDLFYRQSDKASRKEFRLYYEQSLIPSQKEHIITTKSGEKRIWLVSSVLLEDQEMIVSSAIDITESQRKEELMISQSRQAAMGDMLAMIAHQWRQPLSIISMSTNTLKAHLELEEAITPQEMQHLIVTINEQAYYLSHTIDDFRNFFKPDNVKEKIAVSVIFERLAALIQKSMENNAIALKFPTNGEIEIFTYPNQLLQSLINIINNAKDAIKEHPTTQGVIRISLSVKPEEIIIEICDNGGGIDPSIIKKIGEPYVTTKASNGTGLGLYMSKIIIEKHLGGRLRWSSDSIGSCFSIALPKGSLK
jgi:two-component system CheB/CheR fusion protein